ncbi:hypothetical protein LCGC14_1330530 [marine sediment metagenome]|uniref:Uncharacterized protein n=1 Tax=marine sediment metagenome TaxID=412755 RepID=A0A0F9NJ85_9ZZZZ
MTVQECVDSWENGNRKYVVDYVLTLPTKTEVAFYAGGIAYLLEDDDVYSFQCMIASRM